MFHQAVEIEAALTDREPAAVHDTVDAESETILVSEGAVVLNEKPEETPPTLPNPTKANLTRFTS